MRIQWRHITWELADRDQQFTLDSVILAWFDSGLPLSGHDINTVLSTTEEGEADAVLRYHQTHTCTLPVCSTPSMVRTSNVTERPTAAP